MMAWGTFYFQNLMDYSLEYLYDYIFMFVVFIVGGVGGGLLVLWTSRQLVTSSRETPLLEFLWTLFPGLILSAIGGFSLFSLYFRDHFHPLALSLKATGHQWYWSYDYGEFENVSFDSYLIPPGEMIGGGFRLLETDNRVVLPASQTSVRLVVGSSDVLHSWALPPLGLKVDANPGRMNFATLCFPGLSGLFFGQCSEICGANHTFMPISLEIVPLSLFSHWSGSF